MKARNIEELENMATHRNEDMKFGYECALKDLKRIAISNIEGCSEMILDYGIYHPCGSTFTRQPNETPIQIRKCDVCERIMSIFSLKETEVK